MCVSFFFFQAEDGIRDDLVTGVQTCALPIFDRPHHTRAARDLERCAPERPARTAWAALDPLRHLRGCQLGRDGTRSEERRVGKECRYRGSRYQQKQIIYADTRMCGRRSSVVL